MKPNRRATRLARRLFQLCLVDGRLDDERVRGVVRHTIAVQASSTAWAS